MKAARIHHDDNLFKKSEAAGEAEKLVDELKAPEVGVKTGIKERRK